MHSRKTVIIVIIIIIITAYQQQTDSGMVDAMIFTSNILAGTKHNMFPEKLCFRAMHPMW